MSKMKIMNPVGRTFLKCDECGSDFSSQFRERRKCVKCKPTTKSELTQLLNFEGGKIVQILPAGTQRLVV